MIVRNTIENYMPMYKHNNRYYVCFDLVEIDANENIGQWECIQFKSKPQMFEIKNAIHAHYNNICKRDIENGLVWNGMDVNLSSENQSNYKRNYDLAVQTGGSNLPITVKLKKDNMNEYYTFTTVNDITDFYLSIDKHITKCLNDCWTAKEMINWEDYK